MRVLKRSLLLALLLVVPLVSADFLGTTTYYTPYEVYQRDACYSVLAKPDAGPSCKVGDIVVAYACSNGFTDVSQCQRLFSSDYLKEPMDADYVSPDGSLYLLHWISQQWFQDAITYRPCMVYSCTDFSLPMRVYNCGFVQTGLNNLTCGTALQYTCDVSVGKEGDSVREVKFSFRDDNGELNLPKTAYLQSGSKTRGVWAADMSAQETGLHNNFISVQLTSTDSRSYCYSYSNPTVYESPDSVCVVSRTEGQQDALCKQNRTQLCTWEKTMNCTGNVRTTTNTPSDPSCGQPIVETESASCCESDWVPKNSRGCKAGYLSPNPFAGTRILEYYDQNECYEKTGLQEDNIPPVQGRTGIPCNQDMWLSGGKDASGSRRTGKMPVSGEMYAKESSSYLGDLGVAYVAADIDNDGKMDLMDRIGSKEVGVNNTFNENRDNYPVALDLEFQFSLAGFSDVDGVKSVDATVSTLGPAIVGYDGGNVAVMRYASGAWTQTYSIPHPLPSTSLVTGVTCNGDFCFYAYSNSTTTLLRRLNWKSGVEVGAIISGLATTIPGRAKNPIILRKSAGSTGEYVVFIGGGLQGSVISCKYDSAGVMAPCSQFTVANWVSSEEMHQPSFAGYASDGSPLVAVLVEDVVSATDEADVFMLKVGDSSLTQVAKYPIPKPIGENVYGFTGTVYSKCSGGDGVALMKGFRSTPMFKYGISEVQEGTFRTYCLKNTATGMELTGTHEKVMVFNNYSAETGAPFVRNASMPYAIASADVTVDGTDEVITPFGIISFKNGVNELREFNIGYNQLNPWHAKDVQQMDINGDGFLDVFVMAWNTLSAGRKTVLFVSDGQSATDECRKPNPPSYCATGVIGYCATPMIQGVQCEYDPLRGKVLMTPIGACTPHPQSTVLKGSLVDKLTGKSVISSYESAILGYVVMPGGSLTMAKGTYDGTLSMRDNDYRTGATYNEYSAVCNDVVVTEQVQGEQAGCSLIPEGEFNYYDGIWKHGWVAESGQIATRTGPYATANSQNATMRAGLMILDNPEMISGQYALFYKKRASVDGIAALHELDCDASKIAADVYLSVQEDSVEQSLDNIDFRIATYAEVRGESVPFSQVMIKYDSKTSKNLVVRTGPDTVQAVGEVQQNRFYKLTLENDYKTNRFKVLVNDVVAGEFNAMNNEAYKTSGIELISLGTGKVSVDYVRVRVVTNETQGLTPEQVAEANAKAYLKSCADRRDRIGEPTVTIGLGGPQSANLKFPVGSKYYETVNKYCMKMYEGGLQENSYCDMDTLREAVRYNPGCYWEAMNYCVAVMYPNSAGFSESWINKYSKEDESVRTDGMAACTVLLASTTAIERTARPLFFATTNILSQDALFGIVVVGGVIIVVIGGIMAARRRY